MVRLVILNRVRITEKLAASIRNKYQLTGGKQEGKGRKSPKLPERFATLEKAQGQS